MEFLRKTLQLSRRDFHHAYCFLPTDGALKLTFEDSLTLKEVESENSGVAEGQYQPPDCLAQQSVAILIPHRNREKHLLYLLHHLHPFLQRQQLRYGIYVIHQVLLSYEVTLHYVISSIIFVSI